MLHTMFNVERIALFAPTERLRGVGELVNSVGHGDSNAARMSWPLQICSSDQSDLEITIRVCYRKHQERTKQNEKHRKKY